MNIEIHQPELEDIILERMKAGGFHDVEEVLLHALKAAPLPEPVRNVELKKNLAQFLLDSPLPNSGLEIERIRDFPRPVEL